MSVYVCVPVLKRYDLLRGMLMSLGRSTVIPAAVYVMNNGRREDLLEVALREAPCEVVVETPAENLGVAKTWNWFIHNVPEDRIIVNDDIVFAPTSISKLTAHDLDLAWAQNCGFSCFVIRDSCVEKLGFFDETISPGYGYYEDDDYLQRLDGRGTREPSAKAGNVECGVRHLRSQTLAANSIIEMQDHHRRFKIAQSNYMKKWGLKTI